MLAGRICDSLKLGSQPLQKWAQERHPNWPFWEVGGSNRRSRVGFFGFHSQVIILVTFGLMSYEDGDVSCDVGAGVGMEGHFELLCHDVVNGLASSAGLKRFRFVRGAPFLDRVHEGAEHVYMMERLEGVKEGVMHDEVDVVDAV